MCTADWRTQLVLLTRPLGLVSLIMASKFSGPVRLIMAGPCQVAIPNIDSSADAVNTALPPGSTSEASVTSALVEPLPWINRPLKAEVVAEALITCISL